MNLLIIKDRESEKAKAIYKDRKKKKSINWWVCTVVEFFQSFNKWFEIF